MIKEWLEKNKIFFEIISSILFGMAALAISISSCNISNLQLDTSLAAITPHFYIQNVLFMNPETGYYDEEEMYIYNAGNPVYNIDIREYTFIGVHFFGKHEKEGYIPIYGYYSAQFNEHQPTGKLSTFKGFKNNQHYGNLYKELLNMPKQEVYFEIGIIHLVLITYVDKFGNTGKKYFLDKESIQEDKVIHLIRLHEKKIMPLVFDKITVETLIDEVKKLL